MNEHTNAEEVLDEEQYIENPDLENDEHIITGENNVEEENNADEIEEIPEVIKNNKEGGEIEEENYDEFAGEQNENVQELENNNEFDNEEYQNEEQNNDDELLYNLDKYYGKNENNDINNQNVGENFYEGEQEYELEGEEEQDNQQPNEANNENQNAEIYNNQS